MQINQSIIELEQAVAVNLQGFLKTKAGDRKYEAEVLWLSAEGVLIRAEFSSSVGEEIYLTLQYEKPLELSGTVKRYQNWNNEKKEFYISFNQTLPPKSQELQQIIDYYSRLQKAGVTFSSLDFQEKRKT